MAAKARTLRPTDAKPNRRSTVRPKARAARAAPRRTTLAAATSGLGGVETDLVAGHFGVHVREPDRFQPRAEVVGVDGHEHVVDVASANQITVDGVGADDHPTG